MSDKVTIYCKNNKQYYDIERGTSLMALKEQIGINLRYPIIAARVNYKLQNLNFLVYKPKDIEFLDASSPAGSLCRPGIISG